jgi:hypothetical protein
MSVPASVLIIDVASLSLIENPVKIKTDGSIFAGTLDSNDEPVLTGARMLINKRGLFLYDSNDTNGTNPTTQIIGEENGITATFITKKAKIANWIISENKFENVLTSSTNTFTGISPSGTYAFWAGAGVAGGYSLNANEDAKFSVTKEGAVTARNIKVLGGQISVGSKFSVDTQGKVVATDADLSGEIKAASGILGNLAIGGTINGVSYSGQLLIDAGNGSKVEIGKYTSGEINNPLVGFSGIQITGANQKYVQLDPVSGIIANKGTIAGWTIDNTSINKAGNVGLFATTTPTDVAIWAGGSRTVSPNFSVTYAGKMVARDAVLRGMVQAGEGGFGILEVDSTTATGYKVSNGWTIDSAKIKSTNTSSQITLDGLQGSIVGGNIVGSNHYFMSPSAWTTAYPGEGSGNPGNVDYISSSGNFRLANGKLTYDGDSFKVQTDLVASNIFLGTAESFSNDYILGKNTTIGGVTKNVGSFSLAGGMMTYSSNIFQINQSRNPNFKIYLNVGNNFDGTFGDPTVVQDVETGELTRGRSFFYGGNNYPGSTTDRIQHADGDQGGGAFVKGDIWLSRKA